jgi:hypothetical protein
VNDKRLEACTAYTLKDGDTVQLGVPPSPDTPAEFVYRFFASLKVRKERASKRAGGNDLESSPAKRAKQLDAGKLANADNSSRSVGIDVVP